MGFSFTHNQDAADSGKGYGPILGMSSEKINKHLEGLGGNGIGTIASQSGVDDPSAMSYRLGLAITHKKGKLSVRSTSPIPLYSPGKLQEL
jgi:hypothetical protein